MRINKRQAGLFFCGQPLVGYNHHSKDMRPSPWIGIALGALGFLFLVIGLSWSRWAAREFGRWHYGSHYVAAELEVTKFTPKPRDSSAQSWIDGVIHPGGENVTARGGDIAINQYDGPNDRWGHQPRPGELEGQRIPVLYWPLHAGPTNWWQPPAVIVRGSIPRGIVVLCHLAISGAFFFAALFSFRSGLRHLKAAVPPER
jgi:hypothetical protein